MDERDGRDMIDEYKRTVEEMQQEREIKERLRHFTIEIAKVKKLNSLSSRALSMIDNAFSLSALNQRYMPPKSGLSVYSPEYDLFKIGQLEDVLELSPANWNTYRAYLLNFNWGNPDPLTVINAGWLFDNYDNN